MIALGALFVPMFVAGALVYLFAEIADFIMNGLWRRAADER